MTIYLNNRIVLYPSKKRLKFVITTLKGSFYIGILPISIKKGVLVVSGLNKVIEYRYYGKIKKLRKLANELKELAQKK